MFVFFEFLIPEREKGAVMSLKNPRILIVDGNLGDMVYLQSLLESNGNVVVCSSNIKSANEAVEDSFRTGDRFDLVFIDFRVGSERGDDFARRVMDIMPEINVVILTSHFDPLAAVSRLFQPDEIVIKGVKREDMIVLVKKLTKPKRKRVFPRDVQKNLWRASKHLSGLNELRFFTRTVGETEKVTSFSGDNYWVNSVSYPKYPSDRDECLSLPTTIGCTEKCIMCRNWRNQKSISGRTVSFVRPHTVGEMMAAFWLGLIKTSLIKTFDDDVDSGLVVNASGSGDGLVNNLGNFLTFVRQLLKIEKPKISVILTSVGEKKQLKKLLKEPGIDWHRVRLYWSFNSPNPKTRGWMMPGPGRRRQSLEELRDEYQEFSVMSGNTVTVSLALFKYINNKVQDAEEIVRIFRGRWSHFRIKLMIGCHGSMHDIHNIDQKGLEEFADKLVKAGVPRKVIRFREIFGKEDYSGCGNTLAGFTCNGRIDNE